MEYCIKVNQGDFAIEHHHANDDQEDNTLAGSLESLASEGSLQEDLGYHPDKPIEIKIQFLGGFYKCNEEQFYS